MGLREAPEAHYNRESIATAGGPMEPVDRDDMSERPGSYQPKHARGEDFGPREIEQSGEPAGKGGGAKGWLIWIGIIIVINIILQATGSGWIVY